MLRTVNPKCGDLTLGQSVALFRVSSGLSWHLQFHFCRKFSFCAKATGHYPSVTSANESRIMTIKLTNGLAAWISDNDVTRSWVLFSALPWDFSQEENYSSMWMLLCFSVLWAFYALWCVWSDQLGTAKHWETTKANSQDTMNFIDQGNQVLKVLILSITLTSLYTTFYRSVRIVNFLWIANKEHGYNLRTSHDLWSA